MALLQHVAQVLGNHLPDSLLADEPLTSAGSSASTTTRSSVTSIVPLNAAPKNPLAIANESVSRCPSQRLADLLDRRASGRILDQAVEQPVHPVDRFLLPERVRLFDAHEQSPRRPPEAGPHTVASLLANRDTAARGAALAACGRRALWVTMAGRNRIEEARR